MPSRESSSLDHSVVTSSAARRKGQKEERDFAFKSSERQNEFTAQFPLKSNPEQKDSLPPNKSVTAKTESRQEQSNNLPSDTLAKNIDLELPLSIESPRKKNKTKIENWILRRGHTLTYLLLFAFTIVLYFRPYEWIPSLSSFSSIAFYLAAATLLVYLPSQLVAEGSLTARPPEIKYVLLLVLIGLITIPIARDPALAWAEFNEPFIRVVLVFIVMVNVIRTEARLKWMIWLALAVGVWLAIDGLQNYASGKMLIEDYRAMANIKGMFGNPNAQALHYTIMTPIAVALGVASRNFLFRIGYFVLAGLFIAGNTVTFSRGGFIALILSAIILAWKLGRKNRVKVMTIFAIAGIIFLALAPGNYGLRLLSIFVPSLDPVGSSTQRKDLLWTSIIVTLRNPWGIGMGNFILTNPYNLVSHNSYTQVSSEMGLLGLYSYVMLIFEPLRRLFWMERELAEKDEHNWIYYLTVGLQASFVGFCVGSFFDSAAYQWFLYYLVAYAVCLRRIYKIQTGKAIS